MNLQVIIYLLDLKVLTEVKDFSQCPISGGYASDLLSCVMSGAKHHNVWVTLQSHLNIVAVASLLELSAIIITEGAQPDAATLAKANAEGITLLSTNAPTFEVVGRLWCLGLKEHGVPLSDTRSNF
jgi:hypothetical protein